ncbi:hypothetical protein EJB05_38758, partial [Eragrostis curvula]
MRTYSGLLLLRLICNKKSSFLAFDATDETGKWGKITNAVTCIILKFGIKTVSISTRISKQRGCISFAALIIGESTKELCSRVRPMLWRIGNP